MIWLRATVIITTKDRKRYSTYKYLFYSCHGQLSAAFPNLSFLYPNPFNFRFTWAENHFLQNEIVLDFPTNIAMVSNFKYLQWKHIHMYRPIDRHTDVHMCAHAHRQTCQTEMHTDTDIYPQTYSGHGCCLLSSVVSYFHDPFSSRGHTEAEL